LISDFVSQFAHSVLTVSKRRALLVLSKLTVALGLVALARGQIAGVFFLARLSCLSEGCFRPVVSRIVGLPALGLLNHVLMGILVVLKGLEVLLVGHVVYVDELLAVALAQQNDLLILLLLGFWLNLNP